MFSTRTCDSIGRRRSRRVCRQQTVWVFVVYGIVALLHLSLAKSNGLARFACKKIRPMNIKDWCRCSVSSVGRSVSWWHRKTLKLNWNGLTCVCWEMLSALHSSLLVMIMFSSRNQMHMLKNVESEFLVSIFLRFFFGNNPTHWLNSSQPYDFMMIWMLCTVQILVGALCAPHTHSATLFGVRSLPSFS